MNKKIIDIFKDNENLAYKNLDNEITFDSLLRESNNIAWYLIENKVEKLMIIGDKEVSYLECILACILSGKTYIPISSLVPNKRLEEIIEITKPDKIVDLKNTNIENSLKLNLEEVSRKEELVDIKIDDANIAYIIFTSGSTGVPKGVPISYGNLNNFLNWLIDNIGIYKRKNILNTASFSFDLSVVDLYYSWLTGNKLVSIDNISFENIVSYIKENEINFIVCTPTFLKMLSIDPDFNGNIISLEIVYLCGEYLDKNLANKIKNVFPKVRLINAYGPTECTSAVSLVEVTSDLLKMDSIPIGKMDNLASNIEIVDDEIVITGKSVFSGYLGDMNKITSYHTKDKGYILDGYLFYDGRMDFQIKYNGYRIELLEIENRIKKYKNILDAVVIAKKKNDKVKMINAYVVGKDDGKLINYLKEYLPYYMIPKRIIFVSSLPMNKNNKVSRDERDYD